MSRIQVITGQYDQIIDAPIYDVNDSQVEFAEGTQGVRFIVWTPDTPEASRLILPPSRYIGGRIYIDASELSSLTAGELFMTVELDASYEGYTDGVFNTGYTVQLMKYLKTDNPPKSTYDRISDIEKELGRLRLDASFNTDEHGELRAADASLQAALADLRRAHDGLETAVAAIEIPEIPEIPRYVSAFMNDAGYVTGNTMADHVAERIGGVHREVENLDASVKEHTYTREEVDSIAAGLTGLDIDIVDELPAEPDGRSVYLIENGNGLYDQWFWSRTKNQFVKISDTGVDLSDYFNRDESDARYAREEGLDNRIQGLVNMGMYNAEYVAESMDASVLAESKAYTDTKLAAVEAGIENTEGRIDGVESDIRTERGRIDGLAADVSALKNAPAAPTVRKVIVNTLPPVADADPDAFYFLEASNPEVANVYTEYTVINGAWELVGWAAATGGQTDISGLATHAEVGEAVSAVNASIAAGDSSLKTYVDNQIAQAREDVAAAHYTKAQVDQKIADSAAGGQISLDGYATDASLREVLGRVENVDERVDIVRTAVNNIVIPEVDVDKAYVDRQDASIVDWVDASIGGSLDEILSGDWLPSVTEQYDDTSIRAEIADVSACVSDVSARVTDLSSGLADVSQSVYNMNQTVTGLDNTVGSMQSAVENISMTVGYELDRREVVTAAQLAGYAKDASLRALASQVENINVSGYDDTSLKARISDVSAYAHGLQIPPKLEKVSDLENDAGYLTEHQSLAGLATDASLRALASQVENIDVPAAYDDTSLRQSVSDVSAFAHSIQVPEAYDDAEIRALIADVSTFSHSIRSGSPFAVVQALPAIADADDSLIYLYPGASGDNNVYTEYLKVNGAWEIIGQGSLNVDLTPYAKDASLQELSGRVGDISAGIASNSAAIADVSAFAHSISIPAPYDDASLAARVSDAESSLQDHDASLQALAGLVADVSANEAANRYTLSAATGSALGGIRIGYPTNDSVRRYAVQFDLQDRAFVEVPWVSGVASEDVSGMITSRLENGGYLTQNSLQGMASESYVQTYVTGALNNSGFLTQHQTLKTVNGYTLTGPGNIQIDVPSLNGYATETWVTGQLAALDRGMTDASVRALDDAYDSSMRSWVSGQITGVNTGVTETQVRSIVEGYGYMRAESYADLATESWVEQRIIDLTSGGQVDLTSYASKAYVDASVNAVKSWVQNQSYLTQHQSLADYATKADVSAAIAAADVSVDLTGYATESWVQNQGYLTQHQSLVNYATKADVSAAIAAADVSVDLTGYATESWVQNQGYLTQHQSLNNYVTKDTLDASYIALDASLKAIETAVSLSVVVTDWSGYNSLSVKNPNTIYIIE